MPEDVHQLVGQSPAKHGGGVQYTTACGAMVGSRDRVTGWQSEVTCVSCIARR